jgi:hypothetical protein
VPVAVVEAEAPTRLEMEILLAGGDRVHLCARS